MNKKLLIVNANYYQDISTGLLKSALKTLPKKYKIKKIINKNKNCFCLDFLNSWRIKIIIFQKEL